MITLKQLKIKLEKDFGWENLESDEHKWFVDNLLKDTIQAIEVIRCCTELKDRKELTFNEWLEVNKYKKTKNGKYVDTQDLWFTEKALLKIYNLDLDL